MQIFFLFIGQEFTRGEVNRRLRLGDYSTILTEPEVNNCFSLYTHEVISTAESERKPWKKKKKTICLIRGWIREWTCSRKQQIHNSWIFTVFSNMVNRSFNFFVSFSINDWKQNVESLNNSPFWEERQSSLFASVNSPWMRQCFCRFS